MLETSQTVSIYPCALVFFAENEIGSPNNRNANSLSYVRQSICLNKTLNAAGMPALNIYTNRPDLVKTEVEKTVEVNRPNIISLRTITEVPTGVLFYAAHFKVDLLEQVASNLAADSLMLLLDTDIVVTKAISQSLLKRCAKAGIGAFDISDQVFPAYGSDRVIQDLETVAGRSLLNPKWYGGEALIAAVGPLQKIVKSAREHYIRYQKALGTLHHEGDEAFISAALNTYTEDGGEIIEIGAYQAIGRHWAGNTHRNFRWFKNCALLHLPGNKSLIERESQITEFDISRFIRQVYHEHLIGRLKYCLKSIVSVKTLTKIRALIAK